MTFALSFQANILLDLLSFSLEFIISFPILLSHLKALTLLHFASHSINYEVAACLKQRKWIIGLRKYQTIT